MNDKKNIDRLFQEKFKDFEVTPDEHVWQTIETALHPKKKRRVIPFWWQFGGIAAGLIIGFLTLNSLLNGDVPVGENPVVIETVGRPTRTPSENNSSSDAKTDAIKDIAPGSAGDNSLVNSEAAETSNTSSQGDLKNGTEKSGFSSKDNAVVNASNPNKKANRSVKENQFKNSNLNSQNAVAEQQVSAQENNNADPNPINKNVINKAADRSIAVQQPDNSDIKNTPENAKTTGNPKDPASTVVAGKPNSNQEKIASNTISAGELLDDQKDSTAVATVEEPNALEELLKKNEKEAPTVAEAKVNRWQVTPNVAPIYFSSTSKGSPIDEQFATNSKSYENNMSYGVGINYAISNKISLRTGINTFTLGYDTNDVVLFAALDQAAFSNLASSPTGSTIQVISRNNINAMSPFDSSIQNTSEGVMTQRMGYLEVPLEMSYKLLDRKFGINVIGGVSTLFLNENEVSVSSNAMSASLGSARNLNNIHFSTNVGFGFKYRFWKSFEANFEPMFKYQVNTFNKDAGNFKPYFIGLYSGVSFNF